VRRQPARRRVERIFTPFGHCFANGFLDQVDLLFRVSALLGQLHRDEPVQVRVVQAVDLAT